MNQITNRLSTQSYQAIVKLIALMIVFCVLTVSVSAKDETDTLAGTIITNRAAAIYQDEKGNSYNTFSETVTVTVLAVPSITVTPDETEPSEVVAPNEQVTRLFRLCNTGNIADLYLLTRAEVTAPATVVSIYFDNDDSGTVTPGDESVQINQTLTPSLAAKACYGVLVVFETNNVAPQTQITVGVTARSKTSAPNGSFPIDTGTIINSVGNGARFTSPTDTNLSPLKLVENQSRFTGAATGQTLNYNISFRNAGSSTARQVRVVDDLPAELEYVAGTLRLNNRSVTDQSDADEGTANSRRIEFLIPDIAPDAITNIQFQARLSGAMSSGSGAVNYASVSAANAASVNTSNAVAVINPTGTVYAGNSGGAVRIAGAKVTIATDENGTPLDLTQNTGYAPNAENINPFTAAGNGTFSFALATHQIGASGSSGGPARYLMNVSAPDYRPRALEVTVMPSGASGLYNATIRALDGQPVAVAGGFELTTTTVQLSNLAAMVLNVPMFELSSLEISKSADKQNAEIGDIVSYRLQIRNATAYVLRDAHVRDTLPQSFAYVPGTAQVENGKAAQAAEPQVNGNELVFSLGDLSASSALTISYRVRIGASAPEGEQFNVAVAIGTQPNGTTVTTQPAKAGVRVRGGVFSLRQIIIGRVFEDRNLNGQFDEGERAVSGARIFLNNGQSVVTDSAGLYNLPAVGEGSLVVSLDPLTVPQNYLLTGDRDRRSSKSWTRLLRTPLGGGSLLRQNFAVAPADKGAAIADDQKIIDVNVKTRPRYAPNSADKAVKEPIQIASLKNKIPLNIPAAGVENSASESERKTGTFSVETTETIAPVAAGSVVILSPKSDEVIMSPALSVTARVAKDWTIEANVNGEKISSANIGETRVDNRNQVTTFSFVGINLRPGANQIRLTAIGATGEPGKTDEIKVWGRGAIEKLEIVPAKNQLQAGGREAVAVEIRAFDSRGNPAQDGQIGVETSAGRFLVKQQRDENSAETAEMPRQISVSLENGMGTVYLVADGTAEVARLKAVAGTYEALSEIRFTPELRPQLMVGLAEYSFGRNAPDISASGSNANFQGRLSFYFRGRFFGDKNLLTLAYDSQKSLNRFAGRDRFGGFDPLDRAYPIFGDASQRFEDAQSNSKLYARLDRGNSYAMFGDMQTDQENLQLAGYSRRLTGVKLHLENASGDFISLTGARPDTAFVRDVFPAGGLSVVRLSHADVLQGSEVISLEVRSRRNPEIIVSREQLVRSVDYNIDTLTGEIFFLRPISTFDYQLNLIQIVAAYEYRAVGAANYVYTGRATKNFRSLGLRFGASYVNQRQGELGAFQLGGIDAEKTLWNGGKLSFEAALSRGRFASGVNAFDFYNTGSDAANETSQPRDGMAMRVKLDQPLPFFQSRLRADFSRSSAGFFNPFGTTVAPGAQRLQINLEMRPTANRLFNFGYTDERNETRNVSNSRNTFSFLWSENWNDKLRTSLGFDRRHLTDNLTDKTTDSNLITAGIEYRPIEKLELSIRREQNLTEADPTYPNQTIFAARYALNPNAKLFFTQRLASAAITPIGDFSGNGFAATGSRAETAFGIESKISFLGAVNGRYQIENGDNGADSFAVIGLQNRWHLNKQFAVEGGFERGFLVKGAGSSFTSATFGGSWTPVDGFRAAARYEVRDRKGLGQLFSVGASGKIGDNWTTLARAQWTKSGFEGREASSSNITGAAAYRPLDSDKYALLFSYNHREMSQSGATVNGNKLAGMRDRADTLSADGIYQASGNTEIYGRFAVRFNGNGNSTTSYASALTYLAQARVQQRLNNYLDVAVEGRWLAQPVSNTFRRSAGAELGYWATPDVRFGLGYNFTQTGLGFNPSIENNAQFRGGYYFTITTKLSNIFNLFGTSNTGLTETAPVQTDENNKKPEQK